MSDQPLGRDRLGRLVYKTDTVTLDSGKRAFTYGRRFDFIDVSAFDDHEEQFVYPSHLTVDLTASPKMTNYQRYFADIAEENEVEEYTELLCDLYFASGNKCWTRAGRRRCPWHEWGGECGVGRFVDWLHQEATV